MPNRENSDKTVLIAQVRLLISCGAARRQKIGFIDAPAGAGDSTPCVARVNGV
jgi:hypothetical protein